MRRSSQAFGLALCLLVMACSDREAAEQPVTESHEAPNPFFSESPLPYGMPQFDLIENTARAQYDARRWIVGDHHGKAGFLTQ